MISAGKPERRSLSLSIILLAMTAAAADTAVAQELVYRPTVGKSYDYGIEYRVWDTSGSARNSGPTVHRCRLQYTIKTADETGWTADYVAIPLLGGSPTSADQFEQHLKRLGEQAQAKSPAQTGTTGIPEIDRRREASAQRTQQLARQRLIKMSQYPGLLNLCRGTIQVTKDGEQTELTGWGNLPFLTGHVAKLVLIRLPPQGKTSLSYKELNTVRLLVSDANEVRQSERSVMSVITQKEPTGPGLVSFDRSIESAGGTTADAKFTVSGDGFLDFSTDLGMPYSGSIDLQTENLKFVDRGVKNTVRIGFHFLHGWRTTFFDHNLPPIPEALSPELMPRMTAKQQSTLKRYWGSDATEPELDRFVQNCAPPPYDSSFRRAIDEMLAERQDPPKRISGPRRYHLDVMDRLTRRWDEVCWLATLLPRKWSDKSKKFSIQARLVSRQGDSVTLLRLDNEQQVTLPIDQLSDGDAEFARTFGRPPSDN